MNRSLIFTVVVCTALVCTYMAYAQDDDPQEAKLDQLVDGEQAERERALEEVRSQYLDTRRALLLHLEEAVRDRRDNDQYMSPLHCTILAVDQWRVFEAEDTLLAIVDYRLSPRSLPDGLDIGGEYFYPAASALVSLRVDPEKVIEAMVVQAEDDRQIRLLTWVLAQRAGSADEAKTILEAAGRNEKIRRAIVILDEVEHVSDLLPPPQR